MAREQVSAALSAVSSREPFVPSDPQLTPPATLKCRVLPPVAWDRTGIESALTVVLPDDLICLWGMASDVRLYEDVNYGQWGCVLWSPADVVARHRYSMSWRGPDDFRPGDLIIGEFRGDTDLVVLRCDASAPDFGAVMIALGMDPRREWPCVASSIAEFIVASLSQPDNKYWEAGGQGAQPTSA